MLIGMFFRMYTWRFSFIASMWYFFFFWRKEGNTDPQDSYERVNEFEEGTKKIALTTRRRFLEERKKTYFSHKKQRIGGHKGDYWWPHVATMTELRIAGLYYSECALSFVVPTQVQLLRKLATGWLVHMAHCLLADKELVDSITQPNGKQ
jgi:hypothetical protein